MPTLKVWDGTEWQEIRGAKGEPGEVTNAALESRVAPIEGDVSAVDGRVTAVESDVTALPTIIAGNYTKRLGNYESLAAAIADLPDGGANGGEIQVDGEVPWTGADVPPNIHITGRGANSTAFVMDVHNIPALRIDSVENVLMGGFSVIVPDGITPTPGGGGIMVLGASENITLQDIALKRPGRGVNVAGAQGTTPGTARNVQLLNLRVEDSPESSGVDLSDVERWVLRDAYLCGNGGDGLKLRKLTRNGLVQGGFFNDNGQGTEGVGGGINGYAGGDYFAVIGAETSGNASDGLSLKSGGLNTTDPENYGYVRRIQLVAVRSMGNAGYGIDMHIVSADWDNMNAPVMASTAISDCMLIENGSDGLANYGRNTTVSNVHSIRNGGHGFFDGHRAMKSQYVNCVAISNGRNAVNTYDGFHFMGQGGQVSNCHANGSDAIDIGSVADYDTSTAWHRHGFCFAAVASGRWRMRDCESIRHATQTTSSGIRCYGTGGDIQIHQEGGGAPGSSAIYGGVGSTHFKTSGANIGLYIKTSGEPNDHTTGWQQVTAT